MQSNLLVALLLAGAYLLGSVPFGLVFTRLLRGIDVRQVGSGNIGTANVFRTAGRGPAALTLLADALKGLVPIIAARALDLPIWGLLLIGLAAIVGHNWSIFLRGQGGKGIATSLGVVLGLAPLVALGAMILWIITIKVSRYASLSSLLMIGSFPVLFALLGYAAPYWLFGIILFVIAALRHRANLQRLLTGTELKISPSSSSHGD